MKRVIRVGSRKSRLALAQSQLILNQLQAGHPEYQFEIVPYQTLGDQLQHVSLQKIGGKGVFVKDIERALQEGQIDLAIHSLKDMPALLAEGTCLGAISKREDVRDCLIFHESGITLDQLPANAVVATSSLRRKLQLARLRPDLEYVDLRGNIDSRIEKVKRGDYSAIVLAVAGIKRLGILNQIEERCQFLESDRFIPAVAQAALGLQCREEDQELRTLLTAVHDIETASCVQIERQVLALLQADCTYPVGALAVKTDLAYKLEVMLGQESGVCVYQTVTGREPETLAYQALTNMKQCGFDLRL
ncbi:MULTISPECIES: hydroxymethylbilane synthase [unclassified Streptococcus]|uniref:hydroxymethylbilane synthase n=1 Tax=unclassified Streptococcus TaxID=2608887 RepID=UPI001071E569|nr:MULTISPECIES: hydroxymethylbilane synthase [unclassified Streptococcus]MBF0805564.1 hydroxymethylbilane synthase [Streptococcus sp. 19428wA2_WM07]TFU28932.1 hydroxymethylbilane synthase [Streptococcus sp. WM07]